MNQIFYSLEEAAEKLQFSETILVRLSQYFKVPQSAYEDVGYLSFKGDLAFSEQDLTFFQQVKDRLLLGESLDDVKNHLRANPELDIRTSASRDAAFPRLGAATTSPMIEGMEHEPAILGGVANTAPGELPPMREIQDRKPYEKAAEKSFERYKSMHRSGLGKVFENMLKEVAPQSGSRPANAVPGFKPMRSKAHETQEPLSYAAPPSPSRGDAILPFNRRGGSPGSSLGSALNSSNSPSQPKQAASDAIWEPLIQQASQKPRSLNIQLKNAAILLRERALGHPSEQKDSLS